MQDRWAVINGSGEWARDESGKIVTFLGEQHAHEYCGVLYAANSGHGWSPEPFTVDDALEELANSPFSSEGGL